LASLVICIVRSLVRLISLLNGLVRGRELPGA